MTLISRLLSRVRPDLTACAAQIPAEAVALKERLDQLCKMLPSSPSSTSLRGLEAGRLPDGTIVMSPPSPTQALAFADACVRQDIRRVVDLRSAREKSGRYGSLLDGNAKPIAGEHGTVKVRHLKSHAPLLSVGGRVPAGDSHTRRVAVGLNRHGKPVPGSTKDLSVIRMPVGSGKAISADRLFDVCMHLAQVEEKEGGVTAFQCADGGHTSATFAAARGLVERFRREAMLPGNVGEYVMEECAKVCGHHRPDVFRADNLASLLQFADRCVEALNRGELRGIGLAGVPPQLPPPRSERLPGSILKLPRSVFKEAADGGENRKVRVAFAKEVDLRHLTDTVHDDDDPFEVTRTVKDVTRLIADEDGTVVPTFAARIFSTPEEGHSES
ncbi:hypothetical protein CDL60_12215 [Roseateles noduli]|nr:hypothetical protein CDL60_12215 [Roseateles noduli]